MRIAKYALFVLFLFVSLSHAAEGDAKNKTKPADQPIQIVSDRMDVYGEKKYVVFSGNAVATQGEKTIKSDRILLFYKKDSEKHEKSTVQGASQMGNLEKIEAKGNVIVTQGDRTVTGDEAVFYQDSQKIIMTGDAVMRQGQNVIRGDRIVVFLDENKGVVESTNSTRVKATIYPEEKKARKK